MKVEEDGSYVIRKRERGPSVFTCGTLPTKKYVVSDRLIREQKEGDASPKCIRVEENITVPILKSLDLNEVSQFFDTYFKYQAQGGDQHASTFIDLGVKMYVVRMNFDKTPTEDQLINHIYGLINLRKWNIDEVREALKKV